MPEYSGSALVFNWIYSGGTIVVSGDQRSVNISPSIDFIETTAGADPRRKRLASIADVTFSYSGLAQTGGTALEDALAEGTPGTAVIMPEGTATGKRKYTIGAFSQGAKFNYPYSDVVEMSCDWVGDGNYTRGTN
jgi:hypothetical protein